MVTRKRKDVKSESEELNKLDSSTEGYKENIDYYFITFFLEEKLNIDKKKVLNIVVSDINSQIETLQL